MKIKTISVKRTKQIKQYEPEVIELVIDLEVGDTEDTVITRARNILAKHFGESPTACDCDLEILTANGCVCGGA
jgi:hypothetical protein